MPNDSSAVANSSNRSRLMLRKNPPCIRIRSVWVPGGRMRSWPTSSSEKLRAGKTKVRVRSVPFGPKPARVSVSVFLNSVVLICSVPLANRNTPNCSSTLKFVSRVATPQNCGAELSVLLMSSTNLPAVAPTVPSLMILSWPLKDRSNTLRAGSVSRVAWAFTSISGSWMSPAACNVMPPDSSMKNTLAVLTIWIFSVRAVPALPSVSAQAPATN